MTTEYRLNDPLYELGMVDAFTMGAADLTGINGGYEPLVISDVLHKAFVKVDEEGTEAAAATAVIANEGGSIGGSEPQPEEFHADHPFLFLMFRQSSTADILGQ